MNNAIRHTWVVAVALFLSLFVALSLIQVVVADDLNSRPENARQLIANAGAARGTITVDGTEIVESVPSDDSQYDYQRRYHDSELYSDITGFYSVLQNSSGLERTLDDYLSGQSDSQFFDRISSLFTGETMQVAQVELTLDPELQRLAYDLIPDDKKGTIIVTHIPTGEVRAMMSKPTYDANRLAVHSSSAFNEAMESEEIARTSPYTNHALQSRTFPGSTFKLITAAAMLESGDFEPDTELENPNEYRLPGTSTDLPNLATGNCAQRQEAEFTWIFAQSCNTPFAQAAVELGSDQLFETAEEFGFNRTFSTPLPMNESRFDQDLADDALALSAIGQRDVAATPMHMNMVAAAIGNGGQMLQPHLVDTIRGADLQILQQSSSEVIGEPVSGSVAEDLTDMMVETVQSGTAQGAQSSRFQIAAKTGTAETTGEPTEGGPAQTVHAWITGFAPADDPQYAVTVVYENLAPGEGSALTGPQMRTMLEAVVEE